MGATAPAISTEIRTKKARLFIPECQKKIGNPLTAEKVSCNPSGEPKFEDPFLHTMGGSPSPYTNPATPQAANARRAKNGMV